MSVATATCVQPCRDISDCMDLYLPFQFFLKPVALLHISVQLPQLKATNKSVSSYEVMEKIKFILKPDEFISLKMIKGTVEFIRFEGELTNRNMIKGVIQKLDHKYIKLSGFTETLKVRAVEAKLSYPSRHDWDTYFRDNKHMNEMKFGERPDTMYLSNVPCNWFAHKNEIDKTKPCDFVLRKVFGTFGEISEIDIPILDPYRSKMANGINGIRSFNYGKDNTFEAYIQYKEYMSFVNAMNAFKGMKLVFKDYNKSWAASIKVDFDRTKHLSEDLIKKREVEREKLMIIERDDKVKEKKKMKIEEIVKEKARMLVEKLSAEAIHDLYEEKNWKHLKKKSKKKHKKHSNKTQTDSDSEREEEEKIDKKIAKEEKKLLTAQRKLECIRLLDFLFGKIQEKDVVEEMEKSKSVVPDEVIERVEPPATRDSKESSKAKSSKRKSVKSISSKVKKKESSSDESSFSEDESYHYRNSFQPHRPQYWQSGYRSNYQRYFRSRNRGGFRGRFRPYQRRTQSYSRSYYDDLNDAYDRYFTKLAHREDDKNKGRGDN